MAGPLVKAAVKIFQLEFSILQPSCALCAGQIASLPSTLCGMWLGL